MEIWKDIQGYEGLYQVSDMGNVKSLERVVVGRRGKLPQKILKPFKNHRGYEIVTLCNDNGKMKYVVHRLVAQAFILNPYNKPEVNHKDGNRSNNKVDNLEWVTQEENYHHAVEVLGFNQQGENHAQAKLKEKDVLYMKSLYKSGKYTYAALGRMFNINDTHAANIIKGKVWSHLNEAI